MIKKSQDTKKKLHIKKINNQEKRIKMPKKQKTNNVKYYHNLYMCFFNVYFCINESFRNQYWS